VSVLASCVASRRGAADGVAACAEKGASSSTAVDQLRSENTALSDELAAASAARAASVAEAEALSAKAQLLEETVAQLQRTAEEASAKLQDTVTLMQSSHEVRPRCQSKDPALIAMKCCGSGLAASPRRYLGESACLCPRESACLCPRVCPYSAFVHLRVRLCTCACVCALARAFVHLRVRLCVTERDLRSQVLSSKESSLAAKETELVQLGANLAVAKQEATVVEARLAEALKDKETVHMQLGEHSLARSLPPVRRYQ
jgi:hypothetical protein